MDSLRQSFAMKVSPLPPLLAVPHSNQIGIKDSQKTGFLLQNGHNPFVLLLQTRKSDVLAHVSSSWNLPPPAGFIRQLCFAVISQFSSVFSFSSVVAPSGVGENRLFKTNESRETLHDTLFVVCVFRYFFRLHNISSHPQVRNCLL